MTTVGVVVAGLFMATSAHAADTKAVDLTVGEYARSYVYTPPSGTGAVPVVLVLPDSGGHADEALQQWGWTRAAHKNGFVAVGLEPLPVDPARPEMFQTNPGFWSDGSGRGNARRGDLDDVEYVRAVLGDLRRRGVNVDSARIFATGLGNGGSMVQRLGMEMADRLAAIAPYAGHLWKKGEPSRPLPVMMMVGAEDPVDPPNGGAGVNVWTHGFERRPAAMDSANAWAAALSCADAPAAPVRKGGVMDTSWTGCAAGGSLDLVTVPDQGHHWPGGADDHLPSLGPADSTLDATDYLWTWFSAHVETPQ